MKRNKFNSLDKEIIEILLSKSEFSLKEETFFTSFNPVSLMESIERLTENNLVRFDGNGSILRSEDFFSTVLKNRWNIFKREMAWKKSRLTNGAK
ncbi:hypothetical protein ACC703_14910 [Rhizobium ruizarguesonis]|nr:hypothetical protein [Rhizobium leguminosarum bv. viciae]